MGETFYEDEGPVIVAHRRHVVDTGKLPPKAKDHEYSYHIQNVVQDTAKYAIYHPEKISEKADRKLANQLLGFCFTIIPAMHGTTRPESLYV